MYLTDHILLEIIGKEFRIIGQQGIGLAGRLCGALMLQENMVPEEGWVYLVADTGSIPDTYVFTGKKDILCIVFGEKPVLLPQDIAMLRLEEGTNVQAVMNCLNRGFFLYMQWENRIDAIIQKDAKISTILEESLAVFENPLLLYHEDLSVIAQAVPAAETEKNREMQFWQMPHGTERMEIVNAIMQDPQFVKYRETEGICYFGPDQILGYPALMCNIREEQKNGFILCLVGENGLPGDAQADLLHILAQKLQMVLENTQQKSGGSRERLHMVIRQMLGNSGQDYMESSGILTELGWKKDELYFCQVFRVSQQKRPVMSAASICSYMEEMYHDCCSFVYQDDIVTFYHLKKSEDAVQIQNQLKIFVRDNLLKAGYSRVTEGHIYFRRMYQQALIALDIGSKTSPHIWIHHFDQIVMEYILEMITAKMPGELLCHTGVMKLYKSDRDNGTEYIKTLQTWIGCQGNATETARQLFIHRSTLLYRMERIRTILDENLTDIDELTYIALSLKLLEKIPQ